MKTKLCTKCKEAKPATAEFFSPNRHLLSGLNSWCRKCSTAACLARQKANPEAAAARARAWDMVNPEAVRAKNRARAQANPGKKNASLAAWRQANPEKAKAHSAAWCRTNPEKAKAKAAAWQKANPVYFAAHSKKRHAAKLQAIPKWFDEAKVLAIYARAAEKTKATGIPHHVDHIVPLQSPLVSGLHWHKNLRVLTAKKNAVKGNRQWPDMP